MQLHKVALAKRWLTVSTVRLLCSWLIVGSSAIEILSFFIISTMLSLVWATVDVRSLARKLFKDFDSLCLVLGLVRSYSGKS